MRRSFHIVRTLVILGGLLAAPDAASAQQEPVPIGLLTAVSGIVSVDREGSASSAPLAVRHSIYPHDRMETDVRSAAQALFQDDTILALGQRTRVDIAEYLHDPDQQVRRMTVDLAYGTVRALVGRRFMGLGSSFMVRVGTASVIASTTYFVVWSTPQEIGVINIGTTGKVSFLSEGRIVMLMPGHYAIAAAGKPPGDPVVVGSPPPPAVDLAISGTEIKDADRAMVDQLAEQVVEEELPVCPPGSPPGGVCPRPAPPAALSPSTPPAVTSGAAKR